MCCYSKYKWYRNKLSTDCDANASQCFEETARAFAAALFWKTNILPRSKVWAFRTEINKYTSFCVMFKRCLWWRKNPMRSDTEVLLHWTTARLRSCDSWHGTGCHEYLQTLVLALGTFFQWIFIKDTHLKEFWKMWNEQKFSINQKHLLRGK